MSFCSGLKINGQLSSESGIPSSSAFSIVVVVVDVVGMVEVVLVDDVVEDEVVVDVVVGPSHSTMYVGVSQRMLL